MTTRAPAVLKIWQKIWTRAYFAQSKKINVNSEAYQKSHLNCENRLKSRIIHIEDKHPRNNIQNLIIITDFIMLIILVLINLIFRYSLEKASKCKAINDPPDEPVRDPYIEFLPSSSLFSTPISSSSMSSISLLPKSSSSFIYDLHPLSHHWILTQGLPQNLGLESIFPNLISGTTCNWVMPYPSTALIPPDSKQKSLQMIFSSSPSKICIF